MAKFTGWPKNCLPLCLHAHNLKRNEPVCRILAHFIVSIALAYAAWFYQVNYTGGATWQNEAPKFAGVENLANHYLVLFSKLLAVMSQ